MLTFFSIALVLAACYYAALIGAFALGFRRVRREAEALASAPPPGSWPFVSVVVPARDEAPRIDACLRSILANDYPADRFEVIVVDDFSEDDTAARVHRLQAQPALVAADAWPNTETPPVRLLQMQDVAPAATGHKRQALHRGIAQTTGSIILTTDADCTVGPAWIRTMVRHMTPETGFLAGPVRYRPGRTLFGRLQALEFLALVATGAGGIGWGRPNMCNSANVAYRRNVYERFTLGSMNDTDSPAGDEVLAQHLARETAWRVRFCADPQALVETDPVLNGRAFWTQRRRWAGTGPRYPHPWLVAAILGVYGFYVLLFAALLVVLFVPAVLPAVGLALLLKISAEATLLYPACRHFGQQRLFMYFLPEQLVQIPYVVFVGLAAAFGHTHWKGRPIFL